MNPKVRKGDKVLIINSASSGAGLDGTIVTVYSVSQAGQSIVVKTDAGVTRTIYTNTDTFVMADRKSRAIALKEQIADTKKNLDSMEKELEYLEKYESEEEATAAKLDAILTAHSKSKDPNDRVKAITSILKELRESHLL